MLNKKIASEIAVGIILLVAIVCGVIFWMQGKKIATNNQQLTIDNKKEVKPIQKGGVMCTQDAKLCADGSYVSRTGPNCEFTACPVSDETVNWKTYKNDKFGFEFKYPSKYIIDEVLNNGVDDFVLRSETGEHWVYDVRIVLNPKNLSVEKALDQQNVQKEERIMTDAFLDGVMAKKYLIKDYEDYGNIGIIANVGNNSVSLSGDESNESEFEEIVSTFKFIK